VLLECARARWTRERIALVTLAIVCFHVTYLAYRNVKSVAPLLRPGDLFDGPLLAVDRRLFGGDDPAALLHGLLGTGAAAHVLSAVYMLFFFIIPVLLAAGLVFLPDVRAGLHIATALSLTWLLGAGSYLLLPSIGPFHWDPATFADLPVTSVRELQDSLIAQRGMFLADPAAPGVAQAIGAFASLHTAICCTALVGAHVLRVPRALTALLWAITLGTVTATVYFGWHYLLDDVAGVGVALLALAAARLLDGFRPPARAAA
jgi:PAP2 superfamily